LSRIEDYALIGDCETAALVDRTGSIDWLCWPRFDSAACFAALLGTAKHGRWLIRPASEVRRTARAYRNHSLILETQFETDEGTVTLIDFMPPRGNNSDVVRLVRGDAGRVRMDMELVLRFDYGCVVPWVSRLADQTWRAIAGPDMVVLHTPVALKGKDFTTIAEFDVTAGQTVPFVMTYGPSHKPPPEPIDPIASLRSTEAFWAEWASRASLSDMAPSNPESRIPNPGSNSEPCWNDAVRRSLMVLKALTYAPTGGIVAAPTTSLPEQIGGRRNWDYRFCWLRDATVTLLALMNAGYHEEAKAWRDWLLRAGAGAPSQLQIMYGLAGERQLREWELSLPGYEESRPVRVGNAAHGQLQIDVYGEVMDVLHQARRGGIDGDASEWPFQKALLHHLAQIWQNPDEGMWEVRGARQQFTFSKVMAWVAFDRAIKTAETFGLDGALDRWRAIENRIHAEVCDRAFDRSRGCFVQAFGSKQLDASLLMIPSTGFLPVSDARVGGTIKAIERHLMRDGFVMRYDTEHTDDGLPPGEGVFLACSFWLADAYVLQGRIDEARLLFERLLALRNDLGLLSEEYDTERCRLVGNFPQAFSHVAIVNTAHNLSHAAKPVHQRSR
jgi:GH15 family glucan-1,4-alpha-glucosidase